MSRIRIVFFFFTFCLVAIMVKLFAIQVLGVQLASSNNYLQFEKLKASRGRILDRNGLPLATNQTKYQLFVEPQKVKDVDDVIDAIDDVTGIGEATISARIDMKKVWVAITDGVTHEQKEELESTKVKGLGFQPQQVRLYPEASLSAHLLGFVGKKDDGSPVGYFGLEGYYNQDLVGLPGIIRADSDVAGRAMLIGSRQKIESNNGRDLVLTIDKVVQNIVKEKMKSAMDRYEAVSGCAIVAKPATMEILALVCLPDFDPDTYYDFSNEAFINEAISVPYEPGSTFKPLIVAAGIEEGVITPDTKMKEDGPVKVDEYEISTWDNKYNGEITMTEVLQNSSNVGMVYIGEKLGDKKVFDYIHKFRMSKPTEIDLQGEAGGVIKPKESWYKIDYATATFGQGLAITPLQLIRGFASVINGGRLMKPYVVAQVSDGDRTKSIEPELVDTVVSEETSEKIRQMLVSTVEHGEYKYSIPDEFRNKIGGKTGTAQIALEGTYDAKKTIASFIGFAPSDNPEFVALVIFKEPKSSIYGSETAAPVFFEIAKELLVYYRITPN